MAQLRIVDEAGKTLVLDTNPSGEGATIDIIDPPNAEGLEADEIAADAERTPAPEGTAPSRSITLSTADARLLGNALVTSAKLQAARTGRRR